MTFCIGHKSSGWDTARGYLIRMRVQLALCHPDDSSKPRMSSRWHSALAISHPRILPIAKSSGRLREQRSFISHPDDLLHPRSPYYCPACRTSLIATRFWVVVIFPIIKCLPVLEFSLILFDLCLFITIFNFILNYVPIVTFWIFTYHKIRILLIIFCFIWNCWIIYFLTCLEVFWSVVS